jgi:hypothetical protein
MRGYLLGHVQRCLKDLALRGIYQSGGKILIRYLLRNGSRRDDEHFIRDTAGFCSEDRHSDRREDVDVVALSGYEPAPVDLHRRKRAAASKDGPTIRPQASSAVHSEREFGFE